MKIIDNVTEFLRDDLKRNIKRKSKVAIAAASFSMYAYGALKKELESVEELRFIFTSPTFLSERCAKESREFYIPRLSREKSLYGTEFEIRLKNELTQKAIARECADWIRRKARFRSNATGENMPGFMTVDSAGIKTAYTSITGFTTAELGCERGGNAYTFINCLDAPFAAQYMALFESLWQSDKLEDVTAQVIESMSAAYQENSPESIYFLTLYHVFSEFLEDVSADELPNEATGFRESKVWRLLYDFQRDAALGIIGKLEKYNGCILADSVGLGKTFTALAVIKYYENRNKSVLVLCPKKLSENWNTYKANYVNNPLVADRLRYDVLFHTDLSREHGESNGLNLERLNWGSYDLVVIDESHNFRSGGAVIGEEQRENRYLRLLNRIVRAGVRTKVLMLSATPVNNRFNDLKNQLALAYEGRPELLDKKLDTSKSIDEIFRNAQTAFNAWNKRAPETRTTESLLRTLDFDFFTLLDAVTIARSRKHIEKYYRAEKIGKFPTRLKPLSKRPPLTDLGNEAVYDKIYEKLALLRLTIYTPSRHIFPSKLQKYVDLTHNKGNLTQRGREEGIRRLMSVNLLKRLESSVESFRLTLERIHGNITDTLKKIDRYEGHGQLAACEVNVSDLDFDDQNTDFATVGQKVHVELRDMDYKTWREELKEDETVLCSLLLDIRPITPEHDMKLQTLLKLLEQKIKNPLNPGNKKVLIFSAFSDTAEYLYRHVSSFMLERYGLHTALISGTVDGRTTLKGFKADFNNILTCFSPLSKGREALMPGVKKDIDILIATDCISEGQNLQDCDCCVNYDIHWNPVRIIQRFGRVDRIGSRNERIQLVNFWPDLSLDEYINLKARVESRMKISVLTSTGDDNLLSPEEKGDLEYRRAQLKRLQNEVVDMEDMTGGISIMDLGLNEFRLDLLAYIKEHPELEQKPQGLYAVAPAAEDAPPGVLFVLKNRNNGVNIDKVNRLHPFYMVYVDEDGEVICDYLSPKKLLDTMRLLCRGQSKPIKELCVRVSKETRDGHDMRVLSELLTAAIDSILDTKEESDIDSLFRPGGTTALLSKVSGLEDFELISFLIVK